MIMDLKDMEKREELISNTPRYDNAKPTPPSTSSEVIRRITMTKIVATTYPNGRTYYESSTWEPGAPKIVKKAPPKETVKLKKVSRKEKEEY